jgi:PAS domain S-box-containing protein
MKKDKSKNPDNTGSPDSTDCDDIELALKRSEEKFRTLAEQSPNMIFINKKGRIVFANKKCEEMMGYKLKEFYSPDFNFLSLIAPEHIDLIKKLFAKHMKGHEVPPYEYALLTKKGERIETIITTKLMDFEGEKAILGIVTDITKRKEAEKALREEKEFTEKAIDTQLDTFFLFDPNTGKAIRWNKQFQEVSGYKDEEIAAMKAPDSYYSKEDLEKASATTKEVLSKGQGIVEMSLICKDGTKIPTEYIASVIKDDEGNPKYLLSIGRDITKRMEVEEKLQESESKYRNFVERASDGVIIVQDGLVKFSNPRLAETMGYTVDDVIGTSFLDYVLPDERPRIMDIYKRRIQGEDVPSVYEMIALHKDGSRINFEINSGVIPYQGKPATLSFVRDITERKKAEETLKESEEKFYKTFMASHYSITITDMKEGRIVDVNEGFEKNTGYKREEVTGKTAIEIGLLKDPKDIERISKIIKTEGKLRDFEARILSKDGRCIISLLSVEIIELKGEPHLVTVGADITEAKKAELAIQESQEKYRDLYDNAPDMYHTLDENGVIIECNEAMAKNLGYKKKEVVGKSITDFFSDESSMHFEKDFPKLKKEKTKSAERYFVKKNGSTFPASLSISAVFDEKGKFAGTKTISRDITERKQSEETVLRARDRAQRYLDIAGVMLLAIDANQKITLINEKGCEILGGVEGDVIGKNWFNNFIPKRMRKEVKEVFDKLILGDIEPVEYYENSILTKDGQEKTIAWHNTVITDEDGNITGTLSSGEDITGRKQQEEALKKAYDELKSIDELKSNLIANVTHELRTPLTIVLSAMELATLDENKESRDELLIMAMEAMMRQNQIVGDLIEASTIEKGAEKFDLKKTDFKKIIDKICLEFVPLLRQLDIEMDTRYEKNLPKVRANKKQMEHIFRNLISNAIKFNKKGGKVSIEAKQKGKFVEVSITDTGIGITKDALPKVFDRFYQADSSSSRSYGGTGLGLAVVKEIIEAHNGKIGIKSEVGAGTRIYFTLPISKKL